MKRYYPGRVIVGSAVGALAVYAGWVGFWLAVNAMSRINEEYHKQIPGWMVYGGPLLIAAFIGVCLLVGWGLITVHNWASTPRPEPKHDPERDRLIAEAIREIDEHLEAP